MIIPLGYSHVQHLFNGTNYPNGAAVTYGVKNDGILGISTRLQLVSDLFIEHIMPVLNQTAVLVESRMKYGPNSTGQTAVLTQNVAGGGTSAGTPPQVTYLVSKRSELGGRTGRGRLFLPGVNQNTLDVGGSITSPQSAALTLACDAWLDDLAESDCPMVLLHSLSSDPTTVTSLEVSGRVATQRRRVR